MVTGNCALTFLESLLAKAVRSFLIDVRN